MTNEQVIAIIKGQIGSNTGGNLNQQQLDRFITTAVDSAEVLKMITVEKGIAVERKMDILSLDSGVIRPDTEGTDDEDYDEPEFDNAVLTPKAWKAISKITYEKLAVVLGGSMGEYNPEQKTVFENQLTDTLGKASGNDLASLLWNGDTASGNKSLKVVNGIIKKAAADADVLKVNYSDAPMEQLFNQMFLKLPNKWQSKRKELTFSISAVEEQRYRQELAERNTALGDKFLTSDEPLFWQGIPVRSWYDFPESKIVLTPMKNLGVGFGAQARNGRQIDEVKGLVYLVLRGRIDFAYILSEAMILAQ